MPKRTAKDEKELSNKKAKKAQLKDNEDEENEQEETTTLPMDQWRVVLTGDFVHKPRPALEQALKGKGVAVTGSISGKTTHLVLGQSGVNDYGKKTGVGSSKYNQAVEKGLPIVSENEVWALLTGTVLVDGLQEKKQAQKVEKATKSSPLTAKILFSLQESGEAKLSLPRLKKELEERFDMDTDSTRSKNALKKALATLVGEGRLEKVGASYAFAAVVGDDEAAEAADAVELTVEDEEVMTEKRLKKLCPVKGRWRGLYVLSTTKSKTGRARCKACGELIAKGESQLQVSDDSLFRMVVFPGDCHEGVSRGYTEDDYGQDYTISRQKFNIHAACKKEADKKYHAIFDREWAKIRPEVIEQRSDDFR